MKATRMRAALMLGVLLLPACSSTSDSDGVLPDQRLQYKKQREAVENLEIPPDLTAGHFDDALNIPPLGGATTLSEYEDKRSARHRIGGNGAVLPEVKGVELRRDGNIRWLEIRDSPQQVWPKIIGFWHAQGILLKAQDPATGIMKTDWLENRADIEQDFVTNLLRNVVDGLYSTSLRDQYRIRIEPSSKAGTTDLYLTHRAMEERLRNDGVGEDSSLIWVPAPVDPGKEATMLRRIMLHLGAPKQQVSTSVAHKSPSATADRTKSRLATGPEGGRLLTIADEYRRAWRLTGVALDRVGFAVEDRDRTRGVYYVRYDDSTQGGGNEGLASKLAFWRRSEDKKAAAQYQVKLMGDGDRIRIVVHDQAGRPAPPAVADRILGLLNEQMP